MPISPRLTTTSRDRQFPTSRRRALRERRERTTHRNVPNFSTSYSTHNVSPQTQRPATATAATSRPAFHREQDSLNRSTGSGVASAYPIPGRLERRQSAPVYSQGHATVPEIRSSQRQLTPTTLWHRSLSPTLRKLGDTTFQYRDLQANELRLLLILPETTSAIKCEILHTSLDNPRKYTAVSYAWGDLEDTRCILLDGHEFPVTESLYQALQRLRSRTSAVVVWADAICINQRNTAERNIQVQAMTSIYTKANEMAIWMGPEADNSDLAVRLLHTLALTNESPTGTKETIQSRRFKPYFRALVALFARPYWKRLWVVQEVVNSSNITVHCGSSALPWRTYATASQILSRHKPDLIRAFMGVSHSEGIDGNYPWETFLCHRGPEGLRNMDFPSFGSMGMLQALLYHRSKLCTDPRDRVYGILGILSPLERSRFPVDYNISTIEVYISVVEYILNTTLHLDVICASIHYPKHPMLERLPSWVPDWSYYPSTGPLRLRNKQFCASGQSDAIFSFSRRRRQLTISAISIGIVKTCGIQLGVPISRCAILIAFFQWRLELMVEKGYDDSTAHEAFCRTLCLDRSDDRWSSSEWLVWTYHSFATLLQKRHPALELDEQLKFYATNSTLISAPLREQTFSDYFVGAMGGRRFAITKTGLLCLGAGCLISGDTICVPLGCSTPILLRKHGDGFLFVGDIYVDGYMYGRAMDEMRSGERQLEQFVLH